MRLQRQVCRFLMVQVHHLIGAGSPGHNQLPLLLLTGAKKAPGSRQVSPMRFWHVLPHLLSPWVFWWIHTCCWKRGLECMLRYKTFLPRCANPLWQPTSPHMTSNGIIWQGQWLLRRRGYLCSLKFSMCTQEGPSLSFNAIKCFLFRNLHNLCAIFSPSLHNQPPLKPFSAAKPAFSWAQTLILSPQHFLQSLHGIPAGKMTLTRRAASTPTLWV